MGERVFDVYICLIGGKGCQRGRKSQVSKKKSTHNVDRQQWHKGGKHDGTEYYILFFSKNFYQCVGIRWTRSNS